jgi:DNA polymerase kappa
LEKEFPLKIRLLGIRMTHLKDLQGPQGGLDKVSEFDNPMAQPDLTGLQFLAESKRPRATSETASVNDGHQRASTESPRKKLRKSLTHGLKDPVVCPVCNTNLKSGTTNIELNRHIDKCLGGRDSIVISDDEFEVVEVSPNITKPRGAIPSNLGKEASKSRVQPKQTTKRRNKPPDKLQNAFNLMMPGR